MYIVIVFEFFGFYAYVLIHRSLDTDSRFDIRDKYHGRNKKYVCKIDFSKLDRSDPHSFPFFPSVNNI